MHRLQVLSRQFVHASSDAESHVKSKVDYEQLYHRSITQPAAFWVQEAKEYFWKQQWTSDSHVSYNFDVSKGPINIRFFDGAKTNLSYNCLDRWVKSGRGERPCLIWAGNELHETRIMTYYEVLAEVCRVANWLKSQGVKKGDCVTLYLPMVCELPICMLACARIGAVHSVVFAGFSASALAQRIQDCRSAILITASGINRGTKLVELKKIADEALQMCEGSDCPIKRVLVLEQPAMPKGKTPWTVSRDVWWQEQVTRCPNECPVEWLDSEDRSFLLYTSGSTGSPKGVVHTTGGFMLGAGSMVKYVFDCQEGDVFFSTADCGWITGHTCVTYGPLLRGATTIVFGGLPVHPTPSRCWQIIEKYKVRQFYTAPTLIRSLMPLGDQHVTKHDRSSLRVLGTVGEPINAQAWHWFQKVVGEGRCPVLDTWWQTETGMAMLTTFPGRWCKHKPGAAGLPFFGVVPALLDANAREIQGPGEGVLVIKAPVPSMARTLHGDHGRFESTYFAPFNGYYFTGDGSRRDEDGMYWITGRVDDVINVSGHRIGTAEVEAALCHHPDVAEAAVIGVDHPVKGQAIYSYVHLKDAARRGPAARKALQDHVRKEIGPLATPDTIHWADGLPKTRSGKIMRRVLRKIATGEEKDLGDISTLADPSVVNSLVHLRGK